MRGVSERSDTDSGVNCHLWWIPGPARQYPYQDDGKQRFGGLLSYYFAAICYITSLRGDSRCWMPVKPVRPTCATWRADSGHASPQALDDLIDRPAHAPRHSGYWKDPRVWELVNKAAAGPGIPGPTA